MLDPWPVNTVCISEHHWTRAHLRPLPKRTTMVRLLRRNTMTTLTPTSFMMRRPSFEHFALFRNFSELRPTPGTALRIFADVSSIWLAFLFAWLVIEQNDLAALVTKEATGVLPLIGLSSVLACIAYTGAGLYNFTHKHGLLTKIRLISLVNLFLFTIAGAILWHADQSAILTF